MPSTKKLTKKRIIHPNSLKNLEKRRSWKPGQPGNPKGQSITARQGAMLNETCPYFPDKTWREALSDAGMRQALTIPVALSNLLDRQEGKIFDKQALLGEITIRVIYGDKQGGNDATKQEENAGT